MVFVDYSRGTDRLICRRVPGYEARQEMTYEVHASGFIVYFGTTEDDAKQWAADHAEHIGDKFSIVAIPDGATSLTHYHRWWTE